MYVFICVTLVFLGVLGLLYALFIYDSKSKITSILVTIFSAILIISTLIYSHKVETSKKDDVEQWVRVVQLETEYKIRLQYSGGNYSDEIIAVVGEYNSIINSNNDLNNIFILKPFVNKYILEYKLIDLTADLEKFNN